MVRPVDRLLGQMIAVCGVLATLAAWQRVAQQTADFAMWWSVAAFAGAALLVVAAVGGRSLPQTMLRPLWGALVIVVVFVQVTVFPAYRGDPDDLRPWVWVLEAAVMCLLPLLVRPVPALLIAAVLPFTPAISGLLHLGYVPDTVAAMTPIHLGNIAVLAVVISLRARMVALEDAEERRRALDVRRIRAQARLHREEEVARLVHDDVLSALTAAMRLPGPVSAELRAPARTGLAPLRAPVRPRPGVQSGELSAVAARDAL